jgi:Kef-type K+ transport system membrane component KefB
VAITFLYSGTAAAQLSSDSVLLQGASPREEWFFFFLSRWIAVLGAAAFGGVLGWVTAEVVSRAKELQVGHLAGIVGALLGAAITSVFGIPIMFGSYCVGLLVGYVMFVLLHDIDDEGNLGRKGTPQAGGGGKTK